jgi:hypothetical protein
MSLKEGRIYRGPDGSRFRAKMDFRRQSPGCAWVLIPSDLTDSSQPLRDMLGEFLFLESGAIIRFEFDGLLPRAVNTGWTISDFKLDDN